MALADTLKTDLNAPVVRPSQQYEKETIVPLREQMMTSLKSEEDVGRKKEIQQASSQANLNASMVTYDTQASEKLHNDPNLIKYQEAIDQKSKAAFIPDQENPQRLATVLAITNLLGIAIGGKGKNSAQTALAAQNGMLEGYQQGRADIIKQQKDIFDTNQKQLDKTIENLHRGFQDALALAPTDRKAAEEKAMSTINRENADFLRELYNKTGLVGASKTIAELLKQAESRQKLMQQEEMKMIKTPHELEIERHQLEMESQGRRGLDIKEKSSNAKLLKTTDDVQADLISRGVNISSPKDREKVAKVVASMAELDSLRNDVINNPGLIGRQGQIQQFTDRYIKSFKGEAPPLDESKIAQADQDALLFSKKYASMLTRYEQALADGSRGFTVAFQKRYNDLLSQNQFNAPSMIKLFDDMSHEIASGARQKSFKLTYGILEDMASNFQGGLEETTPVTKTATQPQFKSSSAPQSAIDHLKQHPELKDAFKTKYGYIPEGM